MKINKILLGSCQKLLSDTPNCSVDLIVTSPPYNIGKEYENKSPLNVYLEEQANILRSVTEY